MRSSPSATRSARSKRARRTGRTTSSRTRRTRWRTWSATRGTGRTRASAPRSPRRRRASTRSGRPWAGSTAPTGIATSCACAHRWRHTRTSEWELLVDAAGRAGAENMAIDEALLCEADQSGRAFLRLYRWSPPCLSFGRHESVTTRYDRAAIARLGLDVVRRPTGGRAVWHEHEVTYAVAAPVAAFGSLRASYRAIHERLAAALRTLGVDAKLASHRPPRSAPGRLVPLSE